MFCCFRSSRHLVLFVISYAAALSAERLPVGDSLDKTVLPVVQQYCFDCHDNDTRKGDVSLEALKKADPARFDIRLWDKVRDQLHAGTMPPKNKPQPTPDDKQHVLAWIADNEHAVLATPPAAPGARMTRRLTRHEYDFTLRDLLGVTARPGEDFPADGSGGEGFENNADTLFIPELLVEKYLTSADAVLREVFSKPELKQRLFIQQPDAQNAPAQACEKCLRAFVLRAYRRPVGDADLKPLLAIFDAATKRGVAYEDAVRIALKAALTSPKFLFLHEAHQPPDDYDLATRLSYFFWSSMPDKDLFDLAAQKKLHEDAVLTAQVKRMLADKKAEALTRHFAGAWLRFDELFNAVDPDRRKFPQFTNELRQSMYDEAIAFADDILRQNGRVLDFLDSDYSFINESLAKLYGIGGVQGAQLRRVKFADNKRGGLLGMAAVLTTTSYPQRTSPVLRGKWVLEQILGTPPPPPPANVGKLPENEDAFKEMTVRKRFEKHRSQAVCAGCHSRLDPPGFGLENFNAIGQWRDNENGKPLDASGEFSDGRKFNGPAEFRKILLQEKDKFIRTLCTRLMGYALNRGLEVRDQPMLLRLEDTLKKNDYHSEALLLELAKWLRL